MWHDNPNTNSIIGDSETVVIISVRLSMEHLGRDVI
jgi:hypothetical protein